MTTATDQPADNGGEVAPLLRADVSQVDTIGGATYIRASFAQSVRSALDEAHA